MCGLTGYWQRGGGLDDGAMPLVERMANTLRHRGPDDGRTWVDRQAGVALGFRRLAIVDLSPAGAQPMESPSGRYAICYNGEIYNAESLRPELTPSVGNWRGHSDTEVMLAAFDHWGIERTLPRLAGMFAMAIWDRRERRLSLVRDRLGKKPLYWSLIGNTIIFGSELRALRAHPAFVGEIDRDALALYLRHACYPSPFTVYRNVKQLQPGHRVDIGVSGEPRIAPYWRLADEVVAGWDAPFTGGDEEAVDALREVLGTAVRERLVSDVPLGAFLSGGYDSSAVVALMQAVSSRPVRTFSIGFADEGYNEARYAKAVASHLGTDHTEFYLTSADMLGVIPELPNIYDEPFADSSQVATFTVSRLARRHVTVALTGDGGDELFAGYNRYVHADKFARIFRAIPRPLRSLGAAAVVAIPQSKWDAAFRVLPEGSRPRTPGDKLHKLASVATLEEDGSYQRLISQWPHPELIALGSREPEPAGSVPDQNGVVPSFVERMRYWDTLGYLPNDILVKVDRASMAVSLEARAPLLDHRVVRFAWSLPSRFNIRSGQQKWLLRQLLYRYVPRALVDRPKSGFMVPLERWLRGPLRPWAENLLSEKHLKDTGAFDPVPVRAALAEHLSGRRDRHYALWTILMFEAWADLYKAAPEIRDGNGGFSRKEAQLL
jgi:asparagine synthase (glutamine-hydrolysing)